MKPIFKYIGGKSWLVNELKPIIKGKTFDTYSEAFAGGLGSFIGIVDVLKDKGIKKVRLNDISIPLMNVYQQVYKNPIGLLDSFAEIETGFKELNCKSQSKEDLLPAEEYFKLVRSQFNVEKVLPPSIDLAAMMIFLQCHSFNGIYRENSKGGYNSPFNWSGKSFDLGEMKSRVNELNSVFHYFNTQLFCGDVFSMDCFNDGLWYYDPPYINEELVENRYNESGFGKIQQDKLIDCIVGTNFIYSNHDIPYLHDKFVGYQIKKVYRSNIMSVDKNARGEKKCEILVY